MRTVYYARCKECGWQPPEGLATKKRRDTAAEGHYYNTRHDKYKFWTSDEFTLGASGRLC